MKDSRFVGFFDSPPDGMVNRGRAMGRSGYDMWTNGSSLFSPELRWALVRRNDGKEES